MDQQFTDPDPKPRDPCALVCPCCDHGKLIARHCKRLCENCGYVESCEDNFLPNQANPVDDSREEAGCQGAD